MSARTLVWFVVLIVAPHVESPSKDIVSKAFIEDGKALDIVSTIEAATDPP